MRLVPSCSKHWEIAVLATFDNGEQLHTCVPISTWFSQEYSPLSLPFLSDLLLKKCIRPITHKPLLDWPQQFMLSGNHFGCHSKVKLQNSSTNNFVSSSFPLRELWSWAAPCADSQVGHGMLLGKFTDGTRVKTWKREVKFETPNSP